MRRQHVQPCREHGVTPVPSEGDTVSHDQRLRLLFVPTHRLWMMEYFYPLYRLGRIVGGARLADELTLICTICRAWAIRHVGKPANTLACGQAHFDLTDQLPNYFVDVERIRLIDRLKAGTEPNSRSITPVPC